MNRSTLALLGVVCALALPALAQDGPTCADCHDEVAAEIMGWLDAGSV